MYQHHQQLGYNISNMNGNNVKFIS
jgi:hypothetical protein